jgi:hypothetical protein
MALYNRCKYIEFTPSRPFGVELEMSPNLPQEEIATVVDSWTDRGVKISGWRQSDDNTVWHVKTDATCGPGDDETGWEIASYKACGFKDMKQIATVADRLNEAGVEVNKNCGLHIHADVSEFLSSDMGLLLAYWIKAEWILSHMVPIHRLVNEYCELYTFKRVQPGDYNPVSLWAALKPKNLQVHDNADKRMSLNMVNYAQVQAHVGNRCTVELRLPEGTLDGYHVRNWVLFLLLFIERSLDKRMPSLRGFRVSDLLRYLGLTHTGRRFHVYSPELHELRIWILRRIIKYSFDPKPRKEAAVLLKSITDSSRFRW